MNLIKCNKCGTSQSLDNKKCINCGIGLTANNTSILKTDDSLISNNDNPIGTINTLNITASLVSVLGIFGGIIYAFAAYSETEEVIFILYGLILSFSSFVFSTILRAIAHIINLLNEINQKK